MRFVPSGVESGCRIGCVDIHELPFQHSGKLLLTELVNPFSDDPFVREP